MCGRFALQFRRIRARLPQLSAHAEIGGRFVAG
jgi:hypothetical protein